MLPITKALNIRAAFLGKLGEKIKRDGERKGKKGKTKRKEKIKGKEKMP